ncbi:MAG: AAA family ATPase [Bacteroidales bacterium]|jgi:ATP-dependent exoDNAse (exonuclease V) alpha subunit|nr:AAA family ATPase [Bacteroidales bacterium]
MLSKTDFTTLFRKLIPFQPTSGQAEAIEKLADFILQKSNDQLFILKGYAGTGKTTLISGLVNTLSECGLRTVLMAPTGRAAKVFSVYSGRKAFTIHKHIYRVKFKDGILQFARKDNKLRDTLFIVDEVSMISDQSSGFSNSKSLLDDLIGFVYEGDNCKMLFIGDDAQLPPVHSDESPALNEEYLNRNFNINTITFQLTEVVRQALDSGILFNANILRQKIEQQSYYPPCFGKLGFHDFQQVNGIDLEELLNTLYGNADIDDIVMITRSNKRAYVFNQEIRNRILGRENMIAVGDYLMAVKNNYYWIDEGSEVDFIANGDMMELLSVNKYKDLYGFHFADVTVRLCDYPNHPHIDIKIILDSLDCEAASLTSEQNNTLYQQIAIDYAGILNAKTRYLKIKNDPYLNAVQVKFGYSLTCHKTQGGQWEIVLVDQLYLKGGQIDKETLRWLYTAITRSTKQLYLINFKPEMFEG